jgi:hypothetical protein
LLQKHEYKEIHMEDTGGVRSFSGPYDSWTRDTDWPKGVWRFGGEAIIVHARSFQNIFHIYLFRVTKTPMMVTLSIESGEYSLSFTGKVPHAADFAEKATEPHFN